MLYLSSKGWRDSSETSNTNFLLFRTCSATALDESERENILLEVKRYLRALKKTKFQLLSCYKHIFS